ncbi:SGNH/GDSL hydrolase family protein [Microbacterium halotolerans]|uniref:SGNH/GDSL hydrolase family protein n=1 Tax=Microbacterium halotolerans TaxID=246613 RepID=UPI000E6AB212|nr:SGNH/GDSL hydrolase family protein [Microbacterium halotolerans]
MDDDERQRTPHVPHADPHPWRRFVAVGDSFTEGIGDPLPSSGGEEPGHRGWADRVAESLAAETDDFAYANLAVRGKLIRQIAADQIDHALELRPDLITFCAGGNDVLRPGTDPDTIADIFAEQVRRLSSTGAALVVFTGFDVGWNPVFRPLRGKIAIYNENMRAVAEEYDAIVADMWALKSIQAPGFWSPDRLHLNALGHHEVARMALRALNVPNGLQPMQPEQAPDRSWRDARKDDLVWAREHFVPWVLRRLNHQSSGDGRTSKRPDPTPINRPDDNA